MKDFIISQFFIMSKDTILKKILSTPFEKLVPSYVFKSELYFLTEKEFCKLMIHKRIENFDVNEHDTLVIGNYIFKMKEKLKPINI